MKMYRVLAGLFVAVCSIESAADTGPEIPCSGCTAEARFDAPRSGLWYNPERSGHGMTIEIQNGLLLGGVYAYDADGHAQWYTFNGPLVEQEAEVFTLSLTAELERFEDGTCLGCSYSAPTVIRDAGSISIAFNQRNYGWYAIGDGEREFIIPLLAGVETAYDFPTVDYQFPVLSGAWSFVIHNPGLVGPPSQSAALLHVSNKHIGLDDLQRPFRLRYSIFDILPSEAVSFGEILCHADVGQDLELLPPECSFRMNLEYLGVGPELFSLPLPYADIGDDRLEFRDPETGIQIRAFRVTYEFMPYEFMPFD